MGKFRALRLVKRHLPSADKTCFAVVGTADEDTRHEGEGFVPGRVGLLWCEGG